MFLCFRECTSFGICPPPKTLILSVESLNNSHIFTYLRSSQAMRVEPSNASRAKRQRWRRRRRHCQCPSTTNAPPPPTPQWCATAATPQMCHRRRPKDAPPQMPWHCCCHRPAAAPLPPPKSLQQRRCNFLCAMAGQGGANYLVKRGPRTFFS